MRQFREGGYNTLVATCVGEEGLDIGDVDLIICFDAHKSPIRLVQRMGRTGRKREGRIVMLVTEGKEEQVRNDVIYRLCFIVTLFKSRILRFVFGKFHILGCPWYTVTGHTVMRTFSSGTRLSLHAAYFVLQVYNQSQYSKKSIHKVILNGARSLQFYANNPRMIPIGLDPQCHKMHITVSQTFASAAATGGKRVGSKAAERFRSSESML